MPSTRKSHLSEIVRDSDQTLKALSRAGSSSILSSISLSDCNELRGIDQSVLNAVRFPPPQIGNRKIRAIVEDIEVLIHSQAAMKENCLRRIAHFVVASWFADRLAVPPALVLVTANPEDGLALLYALGALCRRSLLLEAKTAHELEHQTSRLHATTLIDASAAAGSTLRAFCGLNARGILRSRGGTVFEAAACRVFLSSEPLPLACAIQEFILPNHDGSLPSDEVVDALATKHGRDLLGYRLRHIEEFEDGPGIATFPKYSHFRSICRSMQSCIFGDDDLRAGVPLIFESAADYSVTDRDAEFEHAVAQVLFIFAHEAGARVLSLAQIQQRLDHLAAFRGFEDNAIRKKIAKAITKIGVQTHRRNNGTVIILDDWASQVIHTRAAALSAISKDSLQVNCRDCQELRPLLGDGAAASTVNQVKHVKAN